MLGIGSLHCKTELEISGTYQIALEVLRPLREHSGLIPVILAGPDFSLTFLGNG